LNLSTILIYAFKNSRLEIGFIQYLIDQGTIDIKDINCYDTFRRSILLLAFEKGDLEVVQKKKCRCNQMDFHLL